MAGLSTWLRRVLGQGGTGIERTGAVAFGVVASALMAVIRSQAMPRP